MKKKSNILLVLISIIVVAIIGYCIYDIYNSLKSSNQKEVEVLDTIEGYDYKLNENDSKYFKEKFKDLKKLLESDDIDEEEYASLVSELFVIDFYSLDNSISKNDVGGTQFVYTDYQNDFVSKVKSSIYKYVESNIYGDRDQVLPVVSNVEATVEKTAYEFDNDINDSEAYKVDVEIEYEEETDYPTECSLILIHSNDKLEIAKMN